VVRLQLHALAYNLGNFLRTLVTPESIKFVADELEGQANQDWREGREPRQMFHEILRLIAGLRPHPVLA